MRSQQKAYKEMIHHSRDSLLRDVAKRFMRNKAAVVGFIILTVILFVIIFANFLVPEELVTAYDTQARLRDPARNTGSVRTIWEETSLPAYCMARESPWESVWEPH